MTTPAQPTETQAAETPRALALDLSVHELTLILQLLEVPRLLGFVPSAPIESPIREMLIDVLRARALFNLDSEGALNIEANAQLIVLSGAICPLALSISVAQGAQQTEQHWIYALPNLVVYHSAPQPNIHRFVTVPEPATLAALVAQLMGIDPERTEQADDPGITLSQEDWLRIAETAYGEAQPDVIAEMLEEAGLSQALIIGMTQAQRRSALAMLRIGVEQARQERLLLILDAPNGYWSVQSEGENFAIMPANGRAMINRLLDFLRQSVGG